MSKMLKVVGASWLQTKISSYILGALGLLAIVAIFLGELDRRQDDGNYAATVFYSDKSGYSIEYWGQSNELTAIARGVARAYYRQDIDTTGWAQLEIETDPSYNDRVQAYAAGMLEGALTWQSIHSHFLNTVESECSEAEKDCERIKDQLEKAVSIDKNNAAKYEDDDPFWHQVNLFYHQIDGIFTGWKYGLVRNQIEYVTEQADLYWLNAISEIREIKKQLNIASADEVGEHLPGLSSALLKVVNATANEGGRKVLVAHNTAANYNSMIRILKRYKLNYHLTDTENSPLVPGNTVEFSGYPAAVTSHDDVYILSGRDRLLAVTGTTLNNFNSELWMNVNIVDQVPIGPRLYAANHLASNVSSWVHTMARNNSGTACKQWMVIDMKGLDKPINKGLTTKQGAGGKGETPKKEHQYSSDMNTSIKESDRISYTIENNSVKHTIVHHGNSGKAKNLFWLLEQVPGYTHSGDLSDALLKQGYWATYGIPYFKDIAKNTHLLKQETLFGNIFSYLHSPRAVLFKKYSQNLTTLTDIIHLMRTNNISSLASETISSDEEQKKEEEKTGGSRSAEIRCDDGSVVASKVECLMNERMYWVNLAVRGDLARQYRSPFGVIDTKVFRASENGVEDFAAISGPTYTQALSQRKDIENNEKINKGNIAPQSAITTSAEQDKHNIPPFQWFKSEFNEVPHDLHPDSFAFRSFKPKWVW